jgi:hypothetical protein
MDGDQFDAIVRVFGTRDSRRILLRGLTASAASALLAALGRDSVRAAPNPCSVWCSRREPKGPAQAACKQACKQCKADTARVCVGETGYTCCPEGQECRGGVICCEPDRPVCGFYGPTGPICCPEGDPMRCCDMWNGQTWVSVCPSATCSPPKIALDCFYCVCDPNLPPCPDGQFRDRDSCECTTCQQAVMCATGGGQVCSADGYSCACAAVTGGGIACGSNYCTGIPCDTSADCEAHPSLGPGSFCQPAGTGCCGYYDDPPTSQCIAPCSVAGSGGDGGAGVTSQRRIGADLNTGGTLQIEEHGQARTQPRRRTRKHRRQRSRR